MAATASPPTQSPPSNPSLPKPGPAVAAVNMPAPPSLDNAPKDAPGGVGDMFDKYSKPAEEGVVHKSNTSKPEDKPKTPADENAPATEKSVPESGESPAAPKADDKADPAKSTPEGEKKKVSPWKLVEEHKARAAKAETEVAELRKLVPNETERKGDMERLTKAEARAKELEDHLRFIDYQNHPEFKEKYQKPYDDAWNRVMRRLNGVKVATVDGSGRAVDVKDILELGSLPADVMIEKAEEKFGKLGAWVAERVEEIKQLGESKAEALEKAKTEGVQKQKDDESKTQRERKELGESINQIWQDRHKELAERSKYSEYFNPKEGDEEYNSVIEKGKAFVDKAWMESPLEPGISKEERETRTRRQAKFQKFAQGFGPAHLKNIRLEAQLAKVNAELAQYKSSEPKTEGQRPASTNGHPATYSLDDFGQALQRAGRPSVI